MDQNDGGNGKVDAALKRASLEADKQAKSSETNKPSQPAPKIYNFQKQKNTISPAKPASMSSFSSETTPKETVKEEPKATAEKPIEAAVPSRPVGMPTPVQPAEASTPQATSAGINEKKIEPEPLPRCPECGEELPKKGLRFCPYCGLSLLPREAKKEEVKAKAKLHCTDCGKDIFQGNMRFCPYCGSSDLTKLEETPPPPLIPATPALTPAIVPTPVFSKAVPEVRYCPKCNRPLPLDFVGEYCPYCGGPLSKEVEAKEKRCPSCGKILSPDSKGFCPYCGTNLTAEPNSEKTCPSCHRNLPKDATEFCPYCGGVLPKEKPNMERRCPRCEHVLAEDVDGFCPYCGTSLQANKATNELFDEKKKCPRCGRSLSPDADAYCPYCGEELSLNGKACPKCGKTLPPDADSHCPYCGEELHPLSSPTPVTPLVVPEVPYPQLPFKLKKMRPVIIVFLALILACGGFGLFLMANVAQFNGVPYFGALLYAVYFLLGDLALSFLELILVIIPLKRERQILGWASFLNFLSFFLALTSLIIFAISCFQTPSDIQAMISLLPSLDYSALFAQAAVLLFSFVNSILLSVAKGNAKKLEAGVKGIKWTYYGLKRPSLINLSLNSFIVLLGSAVYLFFVFVPALGSAATPLGIALMLGSLILGAALCLIKTILLFPLPKNSKPLAIIGLILTILSLAASEYGFYLFEAFLSFRFINSSNPERLKIIGLFILPVGVFALLFIIFWINSLVKSIQALRTGCPKEKK